MQKYQSGSYSEVASACKYDNAEIEIVEGVEIRRWDYLVFGFWWTGLLDDASVNVRHRDIVSA